MLPETDYENRFFPGTDELMPRRIVVKFRDEIDLPYEEGIDEFLNEIGPWEELAADFEGQITVRPVFTSLKPAQIERLVELAESRDPDYRAPNFYTFFGFIVPNEDMAFEILERLSSWETIEYFYLESLPAPPPAEPLQANLKQPTQRYLGPPQIGVPGALHMGGINVTEVWMEAGSSGEKVTFVDIEKGWDLGHEDFLDMAGAGVIPAVLDGINLNEKAHGTAVMGIMAAQDNEVGCIGIAHKSTGKVVSIWDSVTGLLNIPNAIMFAIDVLSPADVIGNVLLLEVQTYIPNTTTLVPVEFEAASFEAIRLAVEAGVVVVEAAGNGGVALTIPTDSGAILVSAAGPFGSQAQRRPSANFGPRIDCFAWGSDVTAPATPAGPGEAAFDDGLGYTTSFSGTSSAAAIVAGAAVVMQSLSWKHRGFPYAPLALRQVMKATGTPPVDGTQGIGVMPNLRVFFDVELGGG